MQFVRLAALIFAGTASLASAAQTIFLGGVGSTAASPQPLYTVNELTGAATSLFPAIGKMEGLTYDTQRGRIVATIRASNQLRTIDPITGTIGTIAGTNALNVTGLAYDANRDLLYASSQGNGAIRRLDPVTGAVIATPVIAGNTIRAGGLGFDPINDVLYAVDDDRLWQIDPTTFAFSAIGPAGFGVGFQDVDAVEFDTSTGLLYIVNDQFPAGSVQQFASLDPATGLATIIGSTNLLAQAGQGMAIIAPEPTLLAAGAIAFMMTRRRRD